jgi:hypothetical protein
VFEIRSVQIRASDVNVDLIPLPGNDRGIVGWMLAAFLLTFLATRLITKMIRSGRGPFRDTTLGGVHVHHQVYGIFLMLVAATGEFTYRPAPPWLQVLAVLFGIGAALTLDEFALWLHLEDVYWTPEGRQSVDAVLVALVIGLLLLFGANPLGEGSGEGEWLAAVTIGLNLVMALIAIVKGRTAMGLIGVFVPLVAFLAAVRLAKPGSMWARRRYADGSRKLARAQRRFPPDRRHRWDPVVDFFAVPEAPAPAKAPTTGHDDP